MSDPYTTPPTEIPGLDEWNAAQRRCIEEYARAPFAHSAGLKERDRTYHAERMAAYRARKASR